MSNPLLWLGAFLAFDRFNRQARETKSLNDRVTMLENQAGESEAIPQGIVVADSSDSSGCLGTAFMLFIAIPVGLALLYGLFFTTPGQIVFSIATVLLLLSLIVQKSPWALMVVIFAGSALIFSAHGIGAVLFYWAVSVVIIGVVWKFFGR